MTNKHPVLVAIDKAISDTQDRSHRSHLGASVIGDDCARRLWYGFRWVTPVEWDSRLLRLFERGKLEEDRFIGWLKAAGIQVWQTDPSTGKQYRFAGYKGHFGGELDGVGQGIVDGPYLLEFKTHNLNSFKEMQSMNLEVSKPTHYIQMQIYMGAMNLKHGLYFAINKNTDEIYVEDVMFDEPCYLKYTQRAEMIIDAPEPPPKIHNDPSWWQCKFCEHHPVCHKGATPLKNCRTCAHSTPVENGQWHCESDRTKAFPIIPKEVVLTGCSNYIQHPMK